MAQRAPGARQATVARSTARPAEERHAAARMPLVTVLSEIRRLRDRRSRGEVSPGEYSRRRDELISLL